MSVIADIGVLTELQSLLERGYELVSGGTENHLVLVNLRNKVNKFCDPFFWKFLGHIFLTKWILDSTILLIHGNKHVEQPFYA